MMRRIATIAVGILLLPALMGAEGCEDRGGTPNPEPNRPVPNADPRPKERDKRIVVHTTVSSTKRPFLLSFSCPGKEINDTVNRYEWVQRCLLDEGQRVTVVATARNTQFECRMTILGGEEVASEAGGNSVRCTWVNDR